MEGFDNLARLRLRTRLPVKLVFDTAASSHTVGSRRRGDTSRHLLFEVEDLCLDLRLDSAPQSSSAILVGQLADRMNPLKPLAGLPIMLVTGDTCLAKTVSNRLGEFQVEYEPNGDLSIFLPLGDEQLIEVPMDP